MSAGSTARAGALVSMVIEGVDVGGKSVLGLLWPAMMAEREERSRRSVRSVSDMEDFLHLKELN